MQGIASNNPNSKHSKAILKLNSTSATSVTQQRDEIQQIGVDESDYITATNDNDIIAASASAASDSLLLLLLLFVKLI